MRRRRRVWYNVSVRRSLCLAAALGPLIAPLGSFSEARAGDGPDLAVAKRLFAEAEADERKGRWEAARAKLVEVLKVKETFGVRYHLAHCEERLGLLVDALADFRRAAELVDALPKDERDDARRRAAEEITAIEQRVPTLSPSAPDGATVTVDGRAVSGRRIAVDPGEHTVRATRGDAVAEARVLVVEGERREVSLSFDPPPPAASSREAPAGTSSIERASRGSSRGAAWVVGGAGAALLVTSGYFGWRWHRLRGETDDVCAANPRCDPRREEVISTYRNVTLGTGLLGAVGLGVGVYLGTSSRSEIVAGPSGLRVVRRF